ncbi:MAG: hypothetical protein NTW25_16545 [Candidatus Kapabacteria bacterium]|nr:hypothetical protein [Candidatus Kapabacteria bacterium]
MSGDFSKKVSDTVKKAISDPNLKKGEKVAKTLGYLSSIVIGVIGLIKSIKK